MGKGNCTLRRQTRCSLPSLLMLCEINPGTGKDKINNPNILANKESTFSKAFVVNKPPQRESYFQNKKTLTTKASPSSPEVHLDGEKMFIPRAQRTRPDRV